jgi:hypothetical protein
LVGAAAGLCLGYVAACQSWFPFSPSADPVAARPTLATALRARGIEPEKITALRFIGDENSYTAGKSFIEDDPAWIWDKMIETAEPYSFIEYSGFRRVEIITESGAAPAAVLLVNSSDATSIRGEEQRYMCHGFNDLILHCLDANNGPTQTGDPDPLNKTKAVAKRRVH